MHFNDKCIIIAGGGTGGHLFPALAIGEKLVASGAKVYYFGSKYGIEKDILKKKKYPHLLLNIKGIQRGLNIFSITKNLWLTIRFLRSLFIALKIIRQKKPIIIIGTGGYSSGIPLFCASILNIPILLHEQNSYPGLTTRLFAKKARVVCVANKVAIKYLNSKQNIITGNPIRSSLIKIDKLIARKKMQLNKDKFTIFIFGGSQGSKPINEYFIRKYSSYINLNCQIIWQCGKKSYNDISRKINHPDIHLTAFIDQIDIAYSAASIVICRSGAISLAELTSFGKAMILIPFPESAENHQEHNARFLEQNSAAIVVLQKDLKTEKLFNKVHELISDNKKISELEKKAKQCSVKKSTNKIFKQIMDIAA